MVKALNADYRFERNECWEAVKLAKKFIPISSIKYLKLSYEKKMARGFSFV